MKKTSSHDASDVPQTHHGRKEILSPKGEIKGFSCSSQWTDGRMEKEMRSIRGGERMQRLRPR